MPEEKTVLTTPDEKTPADKPLIVEVRDKTFHQILKEQQEERATAPLENKPAEPTDEEKKKEDDERQAKEAQEAKDKIEAEEQERKQQQDLATKAAEEVVNKQKAEEQAKLDKAKAEEDEKKRQEALKPKFTGKDKDGNTVPLSYEELHAENVRVAKELAKEEIKAELAAEKAKEKAEQEQQAQTEAQKQQAQKSFEDQLQKELDHDLNDLYAGNKLPKIKDPKDPNDPGNKEYANLFETAQRVNAERMAKGEPPIRSIKLIYYEHYKPLANPPGYDAPVLGSESPLSHEAPEDRYIPSRDRNKSMAQLVKEETQRLTRKMNVRGM